MTEETAKWKLLEGICKRQLAKAQKTLNLLELEDEPDPEVLKKQTELKKEALQGLEYLERELSPLPGTYNPWRDPAYWRKKEA